MSDRLRTWWIALSLREKRLILVMLALLAVTLLWLGVARPITDALADARARQSAAIDRLGQVAAAADLLRGRGVAPAGDGAPLDRLVAKSAADAGFTLESNVPAGPDAVAIAIPSARPPALFVWLAALEGQGVAVGSLTVTPGGGGTVTARAVLRRSAP